MPYPGVTLEMLLNHTGGLPDEDWCIEFLDRTDRPIGNAELIEILENHPPAPLFEPGKGWAYSNIAYELAASIVEKAADCRFEAFLRRELFAPAGMTATAVYHRYAGAPAPEGFADSRVVENGALARPEASAGARFIVPLEGVNGAGRVYTNIGDMGRWDAALRTGRILNETAQARLRAWVDTGTGERYGLGWFIDEGGALLRHGGFWPGYVNEFARWPEAGRALIILTNLTRDQRAMDSLAACARALVAGRESPGFVTTRDRMAASVPPEAMAALAGRYAPGEVRFAGGALCFTWGDGVELPFVPMGQGVFWSPADRNDYVFSEGALTVRSRAASAACPGPRTPLRRELQHGPAPVARNAERRAYRRKAEHAPPDRSVRALADDLLHIVRRQLDRNQPYRQNRIVALDDPPKVLDRDVGHKAPHAVLHRSDHVNPPFQIAPPLAAPRRAAPINQVPDLMSV